MKKQLITLLDLGGVVFQSTGTSNHKVNWKVISKLNDQYAHPLNIGEDQFPDFLFEYNQLTHQSLTKVSFLEAVFDTLEMNERLIERIRAHSDIVIVSDNYRENIEYISDRFRFHDWAIEQIYSFDYQMVKSNPLFFKRLLKELDQYEAQHMILIDDSKDKIASAERNGIQGILFKNNDQTINQLKKYHR